MQLKDLIKNVSAMTDAELQEHVRSMRHNKYVARPAAAKRRDDERKGTVRKVTGKIYKMVAAMSAKEKAVLLKELGA